MGKIPHVARDPLGMTDGELRAQFGRADKADVLRSLILAERDAIRAGAVREDRTLRNFWYDHIKPVLSRAGRLAETTKGPKAQDVDWDGLLSKYLASLVRKGETSYAELRIVDGSRQRQPATAIAHTVADVRLVGAHYPWVILFTEKDTIWPEVENLASLYGVSAISGGGQPAAACTADVVRQILACDAYDGQDLILLSLTDYDPFGFKIADSQRAQLQELAGAVAVRHDRLGLNPVQLSRAERDAKAYTPKDAGLAEWYAETGGVDGRPLGLELDALPFSRLRAIFADGIERRVDLSQRRNDLRESFLELLAWDLLRPGVEVRKRNMVAAAKANGLWERIKETSIPDGLFSAAAAAGWNSINPAVASYRGKPLFDCADEVLRVMAQTME